MSMATASMSLVASTATTATSFLNLFFDVKLTDSTTFRVGRQELLYGDQRHVSPLDWANTRRTFEGLKVMHQGDDWAVDGFLTALVPVVPFQFDEADWNQKFYGVYATYTGATTANYDLFYLGYDDSRPLASSAGDFSLHTFGTRIWGGSGAWLYEMEAAYQTGRQSNIGGAGFDHRAGMCTVGAGRKLDMNWSPTIWCYYDYASGDDNDGGAFNAYNQLFPLAHKYLGFIDAVQRSNISSPNCLLTMSPTAKTKLLFWYYYFGAAEANTPVPSIGGTPAQEIDETEFGNELDCILQYTFGPRSNILFGYSHLWAGDKIINGVDADFFYTQWELNF